MGSGMSNGAIPTSVDPRRPAPGAYAHVLAAQLGARSGDFAGHLRVHHPVPLSAGEGGRHQHDARPAATRSASSSTSSSIASSPSSAATWWSSGIPAIREKLHQARDRRAGRQRPHRRRRVFVNGRRLREDYVPDDFADDRSYPETVVPPRLYFVLGDHRTLSNDSRDLGPVADATSTAKPSSSTGRWILGIVK